MNGESPPHRLRVGNLHTRRDITDVRDVIVALYLLQEQGEAGEVYNLCRGMAYLISDVLDETLKRAKVNVEITVDRELLRPTDEPIILGSNKKLRAATGWKPSIPIEKTIEDLFTYWHSKGRSSNM